MHSKLASLRRVYQNPQNENCQPCQFHQIEMTSVIVYILLNHFALLAIDNTNDIVTNMPLTNLKDDPINLPQTEHDMGPPAPSIYIKNISNNSTFSKVLTNITN